jgi:hypothetical protein
MHGILHALFWAVALCIEAAVTIVLDRRLRRP